MEDDEVDWTDEELHEEKAKKANSLALSELNDLILSIIPDFSLIARDGYCYDGATLISGTFMLSPYTIRRQSLKKCLTRVSSLLRLI